MNTTLERLAPVEFRMAGGTLTGTAIHYGQKAQDRAEMFVPGAFVSGLETAALNLQHDREHLIAEQPNELTFTDTVRSLAVRATLRPDSAEARLVARGALRGLSVEFVALEESRDNGLRVVTKAHLAGVGLVDRGSYLTDDLEIRQRMEKAWLTATIPTGKTMECRCQGPDCQDVEFAEGAFDDLGKTGDVLAVGGGGYSNVLGSLRRGTLVTRKTSKGLQVGLTNAETETTRRVIEGARVAPVYVRPILDLELSEFVDVAATRHFSKANTRAFLVKPTDATSGHAPAKIVEDVLEEIAKLPTKLEDVVNWIVEGRRRIWL